MKTISKLFAIGCLIMGGYEAVFKGRYDQGAYFLALSIINDMSAERP